MSLKFTGMNTKSSILRLHVFKLFLILPFSIYKNTNAQVMISFGTPPVAVNPQSILHLQSAASNKGLLLTRLELQSVDLPAPLTAHVAGMIVYNTATAGTTPNNVTPGLYYNNGTIWIKMTTKTPIVGDIKNGFQAADHNGWYILDGRAVTTIAVRQRAVAVALGFAANLPNAADRFLKNKNLPANVAGTLAGVDTFTIARANLPNFNFAGTTDTEPNHTHTYTDNPVTAINVAAGTNNPVANNVAANFDVFTAGAHTHTLTFALGSSTPVNFEPGNIITNVFIYLGN